MSYRRYRRNVAARGNERTHELGRFAAAERHVQFAVDRFNGHVLAERARCDRSSAVLRLGYHYLDHISVAAARASDLLDRHGAQKHAAVENANAVAHEIELCQLMA